jgi:hypothetical protein
VTPNRVSASAPPLSQSVEAGHRHRGEVMGGKSPVEASAEEACGFAEFSRPREWAEADRARAIIVMKRFTEPLGRRRMAAEALVERFDSV